MCCTHVGIRSRFRLGAENDFVLKPVFCLERPEPSLKFLRTSVFWGLNRNQRLNEKVLCCFYESIDYHALYSGRTMAHVTHFYTKRSDSTRRNHITPVRRRLIHFCIGFIIGFGIIYTLSIGNMCKPVAVELPLDITNDSSSFLFVGVMTAQIYLDTRATAVYNTWGRQVPGKIAFFSSAQSVRPASLPELPLVPLQGVDDSYPPQKKSFLMLKYMWQHFGDKYEWFVRADDDVYIRTDKLEEFLRSVDSNKTQFIGQAGRGNQEEFGLLSLEYDENFCMGGPGIIMSRETLKRVAPHAEYCLQNLYTTHEDVELGRCVQKFAQIPCTWSYEMQSIFYHNSSGSAAFTGNLKTKEVHRAITLHPVKQHKHMYRIHNYMQGLKVLELQQRKLYLYRDLHLMESLLQPQLNILLMEPNEQDLLFQESSLFGVQPGLNKYKPKTEDDLFSWDFISHTLYSHTNMNPRRRLESYVKEGLDDVIREVMDNINLFSRERGRVIEFQQILYGYYRLNPLYGPDYIMDILLTFKKYRGRKMTVPVRRHAYLQQQFTGFEIREVIDGVEVPHPSAEDVGKSLEEAIAEQRAKKSEELNSNYFIAPYSNELSQPKDPEKPINFIVPLFRRLQPFERFINNYETVCLKRRENTVLYVILFMSGSEDDSFDKVSAIVKGVENQYAWSKIVIIPVYDTFSRAKALSRGISLVGSETQAGELIFFVDVDMAWSSETLQRIRWNTVEGKSAYFPIVYSEFDPMVVYNRSVSPNHFLINEESGYWRQYGFGIASVYKRDILEVGGFNTLITGWGKEDVDVFDKFVKSFSNITVIRAVDPHLVHIFHIVDCDPSLDIAQYTMCRNTRYETYGSVNQLANMYYKNKTEKGR